MAGRKTGAPTGGEDGKDTISASRKRGGKSQASGGAGAKTEKLNVLRSERFAHFYKNGAVTAKLEITVAEAAGVVSGKRSVVSAKSAGEADGAKAAGGAVDVKATGGAVNVKTQGGAVNVKTQGGAVDAKAAGEAVGAKTQGGAVDVKATGGAVDAKAAGEAVDAKLTGGAADIKATSGAVDAKASGGAADVKVASGAVDVKATSGAADAKSTGETVDAKNPGGATDLKTSGGRKKRRGKRSERAHGGGGVFGFIDRHAACVREAFDREISAAADGEYERMRAAGRAYKYRPCVLRAAYTVARRGAKTVVFARINCVCGRAVLFSGEAEYTFYRLGGREFFARERRDYSVKNS